MGSWLVSEHKGSGQMFLPLSLCCDHCLVVVDSYSESGFRVALVFI